MRRRVLIRTLPLSNGNYGGVLQAYALQVVMRRIGLDPFTDATRAEASRGRMQPLKRVIKAVAVRTPGLDRVVPNSWHADVLIRLLRRPTDQFVSRRIATCQVYSGRRRANEKLVDSFGCFVAGSDQVWRAAYGDVPSYLFDFLSPRQSSGPVISYAASFGMDDMSDYSPQLIEATSRLVARFSRVSVREASGVELVGRNWGCVAERHVDPTMLLDATDYSKLAGEKRSTSTGPTLLAYVLDKTPEIDTAIERYASDAGYGVEHLMPLAPTSLKEYRSSPQSYRRPTVSSWLRSIRDADLVVTDSFHGTVFSILFNRPFVAVVNSQRGATRFESLLELVDLRARLTDDPLARLGAIARQPTEWAGVNAVVAVERTRGLEYLQEALAPRA